MQKIPKEITTERRDETFHAVGHAPIYYPISFCVFVFKSPQKIHIMSPEWVHNRNAWGKCELSQKDGEGETTAARQWSSQQLLREQNRWLLGRAQRRAALTLQREWVRWRGEFMSLGVDDRSPSTAEASEMMEGWREWMGLTRTAATKRDKRGERTGLPLSREFGAPTIQNEGEKNKIKYGGPSILVQHHRIKISLQINGGRKRGYIFLTSCSC